MKQQELCQKHNEQIIAFDFSEELDNQLCLKCLIPLLEEKQVITVDQASEMLSKIKEFSAKLHVQNSSNLKEVKIIFKKILQMKVITEQQLNKVIENFKQWMIAIEEQNSLIELKIFDPSTLRKSEYKQILIDLQETYKGIIDLKSTIQQQLKVISQDDNIKSSLNQLQSIVFLEQHTEQKLIEKEQRIEQNRTPNIKLLCREHDTEIIMLDLNKKQHCKNRLACVYCQFENKTNYTPIKIAKQQWDEFNKQNNNEIRKLEEKEKFRIHYEMFQNTINEICSYLDQKHQIIDQLNEQRLQGCNKDWNLCTKEEIMMIAETLSIATFQGLQSLDINKEFNQISQAINLRAKDKLRQLNEKLSQSHYLISGIIEIDNSQQQNETEAQRRSNKDKSYQIQVYQQDFQCQTIVLQKKDQMIQTDQQEFIQSQCTQIAYHIQKQINYTLIDQQPIKQDESCLGLCFNKDSNILAVSSDFDIKMFKFEKGKMTEIQLLKGHTQPVTALYIGNGNQIYSGGWDHQIIIWIFQNNQWKLHQQLKGHVGQIWCIILNQEEDQIITCSPDQQIKCWMNVSDQWQCVQTIKHSDQIRCLSLNEQQNLLLCSGHDEKQLYIYKCDSLKQWSIIQRLKAECYVQSVSFIGSDIFVYQMSYKGKLIVYDFICDELKLKQEMNLMGQGHCELWFHLQYCKQKKVLLSRCSKFINIIKIDINNLFTVGQEIEFKTTSVYGRLTDDGKFLVTWDYDSKQLQVRQLR